MTVFLALWALTSLVGAHLWWSFRMSQELDTLKAAVANNGSVVQSAVALIDGLADRLEAAIEKANEDEDDAALTALAEDIRAQSKALSEAVAANTTAGGANPQSGATGSAGGPGDSPVAQ